MHRLRMLRIFPQDGLPDISSGSWKDDIAWCIGEDFLSTIKKELKEDPYFGLRCKHCDKNLQPWNGDDVYVVSYHLEDHYRFPLIKPGQIEPSRKVQRQIKDLYGNRCFGCNKKKKLHIDHIIPAGMVVMQNFVICSLYAKNVGN